MSKWLSLFLSCFVLITLCQCNRGEHHNSLKKWLQDNGKLKTLSTTCMVSDLVSKVGGEYVDNMCLIGPELDPHSYQLVKGDDEKLAFAQIIFFSGLGLEHGPSLNQYLSNSDKAVGLGDEIGKQYPEVILAYDNQTDPHIWTDISLWMRALPIIVQTLSDHDPSHAETYRANAEKLYKQMEKAHEDVKEILADVPDDKRYLVTSHDAFNYFAHAYLATDQERKDNNWQARFQAPEGLSPESQLSSRHIQEILEHLMKYRIRIIFPESNVSKDSIRKLVQAAQEEGMRVNIADTPLYADAMGPEGSPADTYIGMIKHNAQTLRQYLNSQTDQAD